MEVKKLNEKLESVSNHPISVSMLLLFSPIFSFTVLGNKFPKLTWPPLIIFAAYMAYRIVVLNAKTVFSLRLGYSIMTGLMLSGLSSFIHINASFQLATFLITSLGVFLLLHFNGVPTYLNDNKGNPDE